MKTRSFPLVLTLLTIALLCVLVFLGVWQVQRLQWKVGLIEAAERAETMPPAPLEEVLATENPEFRKVVLLCRGLNTAPFVELRSIEEGTPGLRLISACPLADGSHILVDRGFIAEGQDARPQVRADVAMPVSLTGVVRKVGKASSMTPPPEGKLFYARDNGAMAKALGVEGKVTDWLVYAVTDVNPEVEALHSSVPPAAFSNNHAGYAATWFGLAVVLIGVYIGLLRRRLTRPADHQGNSR